MLVCSSRNDNIGERKRPLGTSRNARKSAEEAKDAEEDADRNAPQENRENGHRLTAREASKGKKRGDKGGDQTCLELDSLTSKASSASTSLTSIVSNATFGRDPRVLASHRFVLCSFYSRVLQEGRVAQKRGIKSEEEPEREGVAEATLEAVAIPFAALHFKGFLRVEEAHAELPQRPELAETRVEAAGFGIERVEGERGNRVGEVGIEAEAEIEAADGRRVEAREARSSAEERDDAGSPGDPDEAVAAEGVEGDDARPRKETKKQKTPPKTPQTDRKPKVIPMNAKEAQIAKHNLTRKKTDYPTMDDVISDWDSNEEQPAKVIPGAKVDGTQRMTVALKPAEENEDTDLNSHSQDKDRLPSNAPTSKPLYPATNSTTPISTSSMRKTHGKVDKSDKTQPEE
ncbi:hypothetical protein L596_008755 [Steinernema carpocapsae]|uniref:Uncharacterized protein n=1 Tax=Steinernema carpocapsae TaxID=34508 RepID=A0A4U5PDF2_STECR|nr:hypothetical protein L596_008755 [Steinernema carpocapsae]